MSQVALRQLGRYELLRRIAAGGMGEIFLARMRGTAGFEKRVIIKTILPHLAEEPEFITKFLDEGRLVVQLTHGNIVPVFDMGEQDGEHFIAMEYIPGRDLREIVKRLQADDALLPIEISLHIVAEVCKGLSYAHRKVDDAGRSMGLVHRDVSPSNVLISREGEVKLIDFGIARARNKLARTVSGRIQGKFCYMSPEQASGKSVDARSDIFSTGVVLYELLTGARPFEADTDLGSIDLVRKCQWDPPSTLNPQIPEEVDAILDRAMTKDLDARTQHIDEMHADIMSYLYSTGTAPSAHEVATLLEEVFPDGIERRELREATGSTSSPSTQKEGMSLDDILNQQLNDLSPAAPPSGVDPLTDTALDPNSEAPLQGPRTATLVTSPPSTPASGTTPSQSLDAPPEDEDPLTPQPSEDKEDEQTAEDEAPEQVEAPPASLTPSQGVRPPAPAEETGTHSETPRTRTLIGVAAFIVALLVGGVVLTGVFDAPARGSVVIDSDPPGARIYMDGAMLSGVETPHTVKAPVGTHRFALKKEDFEDTETYQLDVLADTSILLNDGPITLTKKRDMPRTRSVIIYTDPDEGATLRVDNQEEPHKTPYKLKLPVGEPTVLVATHDRCARTTATLDADFAETEYTLTLQNCDDPEEDAQAVAAATQDTTEETEPEPTPQPARPVRLTIQTDPADAQLRINGEDVGTGAVTRAFQPREHVTIVATRDGYEPAKQTVAPRRVRGGVVTLTLDKKPVGCLNITLHRPQVGDIYIDGALYKKTDRRAVTGISLPAGMHTIRVVNEAAEKREEQTIEITPGQECPTAKFFE